VRLAARGSCLLENTVEYIEEQELRDALWRRARGILLKSLALAVVFTATVMLINV